MKIVKRNYTTLFIIMLLIVGNNICSAKPDDGKEEKLKVLVMTGIHDYDTLAFDAMISSFTQFDCTIKREETNPGDLFENVKDFEFDIIALYNFKQSLSEIHKKKLIKILKQGVGLVVMHHAIAGFPDWVEYEKTIGATYVLKEQTRDSIFYKRPEYKHDVEMNIKIEDKDHPITKGVSDFTILDETYKYWVYHEGNNLLLSTDNKLSNHQIAWTRENKDNRVFVIQLGHDKHAFENENYRKLITQGIEWVASD